MPGKLEGMGVYTLGMLRVLVQQHPHIEWHFLFDRPPVQEYKLGPNVYMHHVPPPARHPILWYLWNRIGVPKVLRKIKPNLYWSPDGLTANTKFPQWVTIHDLNFIHHPEWVPSSSARYYKKWVAKSAKEASHVFTVSQYVKHDIIKTLGVEEENISVTYNAPQVDMRPGPETRENYFCFVGALTPRKNLRTLLLGFDQWKKNHPERADYVLKIAGEPHFNDPLFTQAFEGMTHKDQVQFLGRLSTEKLQELYRKATALCMPSAHEGFGIPVVEAHMCNTPVIISNNTALPEVAAPCSLRVETYDINGWADALERMAQDPSSYAKDCVDYASRFTWMSSVNAFNEALRKITSTGPLSKVHGKKRKR